MLYNFGMRQKSSKKLGKAKAREEFSYLVEYVSKGGGPVEITDYGKTAAILIGEEEYKWLCANQLKKKPKREARGIFKILKEGDLEKARLEVLEDFERSLNATAEKL